MKCKIGDKVFIKTKEQLLNSGWNKLYSESLLHPTTDSVVVQSMLFLLGQECTICGVGFHEENKYYIYSLEEYNSDDYAWSLEMFFLSH